MADPNTPTTSPFDTTVQQSPFGDVQATADAQPNDNVATPVRSQTMALALLGRTQQSIRDDMGTALESSLKTAHSLIEGGQENLTRMQSVIEGTKDRIAGLNSAVGTDMGNGQLLTPEIINNVQQTAATDRANQMDTLAHSSLEDEAIRTIEDKIRGGDVVEAQAMINRMDPSKATSYGVMRDFYKKDLLIANAIEKAGFDDNEESFLHKTLTALTSLPEEFLMFKSQREPVGLVDKGTGGYGGSGVLDYLFPGSAIQEQVRAWHSMSADQQAEYLPKLLENIKNSGTHFGMSDPGTTLALLSRFKGDVDDWSKTTENGEAFLNIALMAPLFKGVGKGLMVGTEMLTGMGARRAASDRIANAFDEATRTGIPGMTQKTAVVPDELVQHGLPTAVNPLIVPTVKKVSKAELLSSTAKLNPDFKAPNIEFVPHAGDVADKLAYVEEALNSEALNSLNAPNRFFTPEEKALAVKNTLETIAARTASNVLDHTVEDIRLPNGQTVTQLDVTINKPFASADDAQNWLRNQGYGADPTNVIAKEGRKADLKLYHGTSKDFPVSEIKPGESGSMGKGIYLTPDKEVAASYGDKVHEVGVDASKIFDFTKAYTPEEAYKVLDDLGIDKAKFKEWKSSQNIESLEEEARYSDTPGKISGDQLSLDIDNFHKDPEVLNNLLKKKGYAGRSTDVYGQPVINLFDNSAIVQDTSGQFFPRVKMFMRETGFYTGDLNPPKQHFFSRWLGTPFATSDFNVAAKGTTAGQVQQQWLRSIKDLNKAITKLGPNDRTYLREVVQKGINESRWLSPNEFDTMWQRATGKLPNDKVVAAYANYRTANDVDFVMRNANARAEMITRGLEQTKFEVNGKPFEGPAQIQHEFELPENDIYNASTGVTLKKGELTPQRLEEMKGEGYVKVTTEDSVTLADGSKTNELLIKKGDIEANQLPKYVVPYSEGGHRVYADKYFVKQGVEAATADGGKMLDKPNVFVTAGTKAEAALWARTMEAARVAVVDGATAEELDKVIFQGRKGLPTGQQFLDGIQNKTWNLDHSFEATFDRELPSVYAKQGGGKFAEESGANGFYRTRGQLYYSAKGDALKNVDGDLAPTIDPFKMQNQALHNVARLSSFDDFKTSSVHRWVNTYGDYLSYDKGATPAEIFNSAVPNRAVSRDLVHQIEGQREAIKRMLNFRGQFDMEKENFLRRMHEAVAGESTNPVRLALSKIPLNMIEKNPVMALRGWAFDMKLGLFNVGQFFIQTSTMLSAIALSPRAGLKGMFSVAPMLAYRAAGRTDAILDLLAKRGFAKLAGFGSEKEFKDYMKFIDKSGFFAFGDSHLLVNTSHPAAAYAILDKANSLRTMGRFFFNEAENWNRLVASRIAYDEAVTKFGAANWKDFQFTEFWRARAENYSFNMSSTSAAAWQKGLMSVPTQFWAYNWRMAEAMFGKQFTNPQKARLLIAQLFLGGTAGVPLVGAVTDAMNRHYGHAPRLSQNPDDPNGPVTGSERAMAIAQRGMVDELINVSTGADVQVGQRLATGDFFTQTMEKMLGMSEYSDKVTPAEIAGGATYSIMGEALGSAFEIGKKMYAAETGGMDPAEMSRFDWQSMARQISSVNNIYYKAWMAHQYGMLESQRGNVLVSGLPSADTFWIGLGFAPGELRDREAMQAWNKHEKESIQSSADLINRLWSEGIREPDKFDQNSRIVSQVINMLPADRRLDVLRKAHLERDPSDYSRLLRIRQSRDVEAAAQDKMDELYNQQSEDNTNTNEVAQ